MSGPRLNRRLTLESPSRVSDGSGGFVETWTALGVLWAEVMARTGREVGAEGVAVSTVAYRVTVRAAPVGTSARPVPEQRFRDGARLFLIRAVTEMDADGRYLTCFADEEVVT